MLRRIAGTIFLSLAGVILISCGQGKNSDSLKMITAFSFANPAVTGTINEPAKTISVTVPYGTDVTALVATFQAVGASVNVGSQVQISGKTPNDFTNPVQYSVTAVDSSVTIYTVSVTIAESSAKGITSFSFAALGVAGTIEESAKTISVTVPHGTNVTALVATFQTTGVHVDVDLITQVSGSTPNDFTNPVQYSVTAADTTTAIYTVTVTIAPSSAKEITSFSFASFGATGTIDESAKTISVTVPHGTDVTALVATFQTTGVNVDVDLITQISGSTPNDYTNSRIYTVTAEDSSTASYTVTVNISSNVAPVISGITVTPQPILTSANLTASANDPDGDPLTYAWCIGGASQTTGASATWNSPGIPGNYTLSLLVSDGTVTVQSSTTVTVGSGSPWPKKHRGVQSTGLSPVDTSVITGLVTQWSYTTGDRILYSSPVIGADGTIYLRSYDGKLYALSSNGDLKWTFPVGILNDASPAVAADGTIYLGYNLNSNFQLCAIKPDGSLKWCYAADLFVESSPAIGADGAIYFGSLDGKLYALKPDGTLKWSYTTGGYILNAPAIGFDGSVYFGSYDQNLYALNPDGTLKWTYAAGYIADQAIGPDGTLYFGSTNISGLYAINPNGTLKWSYAIGGLVYSAPAIGPDGTIYAGSSDGKLYAVKPDGSFKWSYATAEMINSSPAIGAEGTVYVGSYDNNLYAINPNGTLKWSYATGDSISSSPAIGADGTVYIGSWDWKLYAIQ